MAENNGKWVPLLDYAVFKGVSLSTLRRHIKAKKIHSKSIEGKYFLWCDLENSSSEHLSKELQKAQEEITELKMLVSLYEENHL